MKLGCCQRDPGLSSDSPLLSGILWLIRILFKTHKVRSLALGRIQAFFFSASRLKIDGQICFLKVLQCLPELWLLFSPHRPFPGGSHRLGCRAHVPWGCYRKPLIGGRGPFLPAPHFVPEHGTSLAKLGLPTSPILVSCGILLQR